MHVHVYMKYTFLCRWWPSIEPNDARIGLRRPNVGSALNNSEIINLECGAEGNLLDINDFEIVGSQQFDQRSNFECTQ